MKNFRLLFLLILCFSAIPGSTQTTNTDSLSKTTPDSADSTSLNSIQQELAAARLNEANLRMEIEQMKLTAYSADSIKLSKQKQRIDSLRHHTKGIPVVVEEDTLFYFYAKRGGLTPQQRAERVSQDITGLGLHPDSIYIESSDIVTDLMYGDKVIVSFTDMDGLWENCTREQLAKNKRIVIIEKLKIMKEEHGFLQLCKRILYFILIIFGQYLLFKLTNLIFNKLRIRIEKLGNTKLKSVSI